MQGLSCLPLERRFFISTISSVRHQGADFKVDSWAATSSGQLVYIADMIQVTDSFGEGDIFVKLFSFSMITQLRAEIDRGRICVRLARMLQLLSVQRDRERHGGDASPNVAEFPCAMLRGRSDGGCWAWNCLSFSALVKGQNFRHVDFAGLDPLQVQLVFLYR